MGNRAVIAINEYDDNAIGFYLHWNGGRDSIEGFLEATKRLMDDRMGDRQYGTARLAQVIGTFFDGNLSFGIDQLRNLDCDNHDNGVYVVDTATMEIVGRKFKRWEEQQEYNVSEFADDIMKKIEAAANARN